MFRLLAACTLAMTFAACAAQAPRKASPRPPAQAVGSLRFVEPPLVLYNAEQQTLVVWVRLNRPLRHNVGHPAEFANHGASLEAAGGEHDIPGMEYSPVRPTCYSEWLWLGESPPELSDGQQIEVSLKLSDTQSLAGAGTVKVSDDPTPHAEEQLDCPRARHTRECHSRVDGKHLTIGLATAMRHSAVAGSRRRQKDLQDAIHGQQHPHERREYRRRDVPVAGARVAVSDPMAAHDHAGAYRREANAED